MHVSRRNASAIAEGAAWVAHDEARLHLAKNVELVLARNSYMPLLSAGLEMPQEREHRRERFSMYCVDPRPRLRKVQPGEPPPARPANAAGRQAQAPVQHAAEG